MNTKRRWPVLTIGALLTLSSVARVCTAADLDPKVEARILAVLEDLHENQRQGMMNCTRDDGRLLRLLTASTRAKHVVEIGTSNGYSGIWFCLGLSQSGGKLTTYEINANRASLARENFKRAGVENRVTLIEGDAHKEVVKLKNPIDILFLDADKAGYIDYLNKLLPLVRPGGLVLAHNTTDLRNAMKDYIDAVTKHPDLETIFLHAHDRGIGVSMKKRGKVNIKVKPAESSKVGLGDPSEDPYANGPGKKPDGAVLGYINHIPPEPSDARAERHRRVAERRMAKPPVMVHRGVRRIAPENTLEAYAAAMDCGADGVEIDIRCSKDGVLYLFHDDTLDRTTKTSGKGKDTAYDELLRATPKDVFGTADEDTRVPTLASFLVRCRQRAMLLHLDVKESGLQDDLIRMFDQADVWDHIVSVNDYNADRIRNHPKVKRLTYKGWAPEGKHEKKPGAIKNQLLQKGDMIFTKDPRPVCDYLKRSGNQVPLPKGIRAWWTAEGIITPD